MVGCCCAYILVSPNSELKIRCTDAGGHAYVKYRGEFYPFSYLHRAARPLHSTHATTNHLLLCGFDSLSFGDMGPNASRSSKSPKIPVLVFGFSSSDEDDDDKEFAAYPQPRMRVE